MKSKLNYSMAIMIIFFFLVITFFGVINGKHQNNDGIKDNSGIPDIKIKITGSLLIIATNNPYPFEKRGIYGEVLSQNSDFIEFDFRLNYMSNSVEYQTGPNHVDFEGPFTYPFWFGGRQIYNYFGYGLCIVKVIVDGTGFSDELYVEKTAWGISLGKYVIFIGQSYT